VPKAAGTPRLSRGEVDMYVGDAGLAWNKRLSFPVHETGSVLVVGLFNASNSHELVCDPPQGDPSPSLTSHAPATTPCPSILSSYILLQVGKVRVRVSALRGNQRYEKAVQLFQVVSDKVNHSGVLDIAITFKHPTVLGVGVGVLQRVSAFTPCCAPSLFKAEGEPMYVPCRHSTDTGATDAVLLWGVSHLCSTRLATSLTSTSGSRCRP
jgi:hypothetical protein